MTCLVLGMKYEFEDDYTYTELFLVRIDFVLVFD